MGGLNFTKGAPNVAYDIDNPVKPVPLQSVCKLLQDNWTVGEPLTCPDDENYDTNILRAGLNLYGFPVEQTGELEWNIESDDFGYVVNFGGGHWVALRKNATDLVYINSVEGNSDGTAYVNKQAFIDGVNEGYKTKNRISQILVVKKRTAVPIDPLEKLKTGKLETEGDISSATSFESKKIILISKFNQLFDKKLDAELIVYINALLSTVDSVADADQFIQKHLTNKTDAQIDAFASVLNEYKNDITYLAEVSWKPETKGAKNGKTQQEIKQTTETGLRKKMNLRTIEEILERNYTPLTDEQLNAVNVAVNGGIRSDEATTGGKTRRQIRGGSGGDRKKTKKNATPANSQSSTPATISTGPNSNRTLDGNILNYDTLFKEIKVDPAHIQKDDLDEKIKTIIKFKKSAGYTISDTDKIYTNDATDVSKLVVFGVSDRFLTSDKFRELSIIGKAAMEIFITKLESIREALTKNYNSVLQVSVDDITDDMNRVKINTAGFIKFMVTPLQYATLTCNPSTIELLIKKNVPITEDATKTLKTVDGSSYTLDYLASVRDTRDKHKKKVIQLIEAIRDARESGIIDSNAVNPKFNSKYGVDSNTENEKSIKTLIYTKTFEENVKNRPDVTISDIRFKDIIDTASEDAIRGTPNNALYKFIEWKTRAELPATEDVKIAYTHAYMKKRASIEGEKDGSRNLRNTEYDKPEYNIPPLIHIKNAYEMAFRIRTATYYDSGFYDGLKAAPFAQQVSPLYSLESAFSQIVQPSSSKQSQDYKLGYAKGIEQVIKPQPGSEELGSLTPGSYEAIINDAMRAGTDDAANGKQKYTTPIRYTAKDNRTANIDLTKNIQIEIYANKLITNYPQISRYSVQNTGETPEQLQQRQTEYEKNAEDIQKKINLIKTAYDTAYDKEATRIRTTATYTQPMSSSNLRPDSNTRTGGVRGRSKSKKHTKPGSAKRRTLRKK